MQPEKTKKLSSLVLNDLLKRVCALHGVIRLRLRGRENGLIVEEKKVSFTSVVCHLNFVPFDNEPVLLPSSYCTSKKRNVSLRHYLVSIDVY